MQGAGESGAEVRKLVLAEMEFDLNLSAGYKGKQPLEPDLQEAQELIAWADHLVFVYPNWWGGMPALLKGFIDRVFLPDLPLSTAGTRLCRSSCSKENGPSDRHDGFAVRLLSVLPRTAGTSDDEALHSEVLRRRHRPCHEHYPASQNARGRKKPMARACAENGTEIGVIGKYGRCAVPSNGLTSRTGGL